MSKILENLIITNGGYVGRPLIVRPSKKSFLGGNVVGSSVLDVSTQMLVGSSDIIPSFGGTMTIDNKPLGNYEFVKKEGNQVISSFNASNWFEGAGNEDGRSAWIIVNGDMTIDLGQTLTPPGRRLFTVIYVKGDLTVNGEISMTARGANHSATGSNVPAQDILLATGTYSLITNPIIPATGGAGGIGGTNTGSGNSNTGAGGLGGVGTNGGTGGGGGGMSWVGSVNSTLIRTAGNGAAGTSFSGGGGGGGCRLFSTGGTPGPAGASGGAGGLSIINGGYVVAGGTGNPGGNFIQTSGSTGLIGLDGTGGILIIFCKQCFGGGTIVANGVNAAQGGGAPSGGGSLTIFSISPPGVQIAANGGVGVGTTLFQGGAAGAGTARILQW